MKKKYQTITAILIIVSCGSFYFFQNMQGNMFNSLSVSLMQTFHLSAKQVTILSTAYFYSSILFLFIAGVMIDYLSRRKLLLVACGINVLSILGFSVAHAPWQVFIYHFVGGLVGTFSLLPAIRLLSNWYPRKKLATATGAIVMFGALGSIAAQTPLVVLINHFGWRGALQISAIVGVFSFVTILLFVKDCPTNSSKLKLPKFNFHTLTINLKAVAGNSANWLLGVCCAIMEIPLFVFAALWGNLFLMQTYALNKTSAATVCSMIGIGVTTGSFLLPILSDHLKKRKLLFNIANISAFILITILFFIHFSNHVPVLMGLVFFMLGLTSGIQPVLYTLTAELNSKKLISSAQGIVMTLLMAGGLLQHVFSWVLESQWNQAMKNGVPFFSLADYQRGGMILMAAYIGIFILSFWIKE